MTGGLFSIFDNNGYLDPVQVENLAAFLMAIRELNNKTDGIADDILVNTQIKFQIDYGNSFLNAVESSAALGISVDILHLTLILSFAKYI